MLIGSAFDILSYGWAPRVAFVNYYLGHQCGKPFDAQDQKKIVYSALESFHEFKHPGQVNVLDVDWPDEIVNNVALIGGSKMSIRPKRGKQRVYQSEEDMKLAIERFGEKGKGIVSPEAVRQFNYFMKNVLKVN